MACEGCKVKHQGDSGMSEKICGGCRIMWINLRALVAKQEWKEGVRKGGGGVRF